MLIFILKSWIGSMIFATKSRPCSSILCTNFFASAPCHVAHVSLFAPGDPVKTRRRSKEDHRNVGTVQNFYMGNQNFGDKLQHLQLSWISVCCGQDVFLSLSHKRAIKLWTTQSFIGLSPLVSACFNGMNDHQKKDKLNEHTTDRNINFV